MVDGSGAAWGPGFAKQALWTRARGRLTRCSGDGSGPFSTLESAPLFCLGCWETALLRFPLGTSSTKTLSIGRLNAFLVSPGEPRGHFPDRVGRVGMGSFSRTHANKTRGLLLPWVVCAQFPCGVQGLQVRTRDFPGHPVVKTLSSHCRECGFNPWSGN